MHGSLTVRTDHPKLPELNTRLSAQVRGFLKYSPKMLLFRQRVQEEGQVRKVKMTNQVIMFHPDLQQTY